MKNLKIDKTKVIVIIFVISVAIFHAIRTNKYSEEKDKTFYENFNESLHYER
jgi:hypothetical protein